MNRYAFPSLLLMLMCGTGVWAEKKPVAIADLVGDWSGTSFCQVKPSPCHDEQVVFRFSHPEGEKIRVQGDKIVDGKAVTMGVDDWSYDATSQALTYEIPRGTWKLIVDGDEMNGTLITHDNVLFRKVHVHRLKTRN
jgi:hypothetical protein